MKRPRFATVATVALLAGALVAIQVPAAGFHEGGPVLLESHQFEWTDPDSGGQVLMTENVWEGCVVDDRFVPHDMTWEYVVDNVSFDPDPGVTNGFSGFQILFPAAIPELYNQLSPTTGGPWLQNAFSGGFPPFGVEWDAPLPGFGILPGESGSFSFCTFERVDVIVESEGVGGGPAGWGHTWGLAFPEPIIDADGIATAGDGVPGAVNVAIGDALESFPVGGATTAGLDWFDNDADGQWTFGFGGDDLHSEDQGTCATAIRDGDHDLGLDCKILDLNNSLADQQQVDCDLEVNVPFTPPHTVPNNGCPSSLNNIRWFDADGDMSWDNGEDIVLDQNGDMIFGEVINTQTFVFHGFQSVPGELMSVLALDACSDGHIICKKVKYMDDSGDGIIEVGEPVWFLEVIQVHNPSGMTWTNTIVKDRWGAELDVESATPSSGTAELTTKGKSAKEFLEWQIGDLGPGETANLVLRVHTDLNPAGHQQYTSPGEYEYNSGAVVKFRNEAGKQRSFETGSVFLTVVP